MKRKSALVASAAAAVSALALSACGPITVGGGGAVPTPTSTASATQAAATPPTPATVVSTTSPTATAKSSPTVQAAPKPSAVKPAAPAYLMTTGSAGDKVRQLQSRLKQLEWYDPKITGTYDAVTTGAVQGFQDKRGMPVTGSVDQATWDRLVAMTRQPTDDEMHNRLVPGPAILKSGSTGDPVKDLQARLKQIGWWTGDVLPSYGPQTVAAVKGFQDKRQIPVTGEVDQRTLDKLHAMTRTPTSDELNNVKPKPAPVSASGLDPRCMTGRVLCISKASRSLTWVIDGQPQLRLAVRFGSQFTPTREGVFSVYRKNRDWTSTLYGSKMPYSMFFSGGQAVHYSSDFAARGYAGASHGCVNVRDLGGIASLFDQVSIGDKVVVYG